MKKTIKKEFFHPGGENLPSDGWFQQCILCYSITANLIFLESHTRLDEIIEFYAHLCTPCTKLIKNPKKNPKVFKKYEKRCNKLITNHLMSTTYLDYLDVETEEEDYEVSSPLSQ